MRIKIVLGFVAVSCFLLKPDVVVADRGTIADAYDTLKKMRDPSWIQNQSGNTVSKPKPKKTQPQANTKYHHLMANMENAIKAKGGHVTPVDSYANAGEAYKGRVQEYYALNPTPEEINKDITSVIQNNSISYTPKQTNESSSSGSDIKDNESVKQYVNHVFLDEPLLSENQNISHSTNTPMVQNENTAVMNDINTFFSGEDINMQSSNVHKPVNSVNNPSAVNNTSGETVVPSQLYNTDAQAEESNYAEPVLPQSTIYDDSGTSADHAEDVTEAVAGYAQEEPNKKVSMQVDAAQEVVGNAKKVTSNTGTIISFVDAVSDKISNMNWFKKLKSTVLATDDVVGAAADTLEVVDEAVTANTLEQKADGAGFLYGGLKIMDKTAKTVFGPIGGLVNSLFAVSAETVKVGVDNTDLYNTNTLQGEAQGSKNISSSHKLFEFLKQSGKEYNKHDYYNGYELSFPDDEGNAQNIDFDANGATQVTLNGEKYYLFTTINGDTSQVLVKIEDEPFWKFWKDDKAKVYTASVTGDAETGSFSIKDAKLIGEAVID